MKSSISNICVFDLETTGLKNTEHAILEIACCPFDIELNDLPEFDSGIMSVYDNRAITDGALNANGITRQQIEAGKDPAKVIDELCRYLKDLKVGKSLPVLAGHNIDKFDVPFLGNMFDVFGQDLTKYVNCDLTMDTMWWARLMWVEQENYKLGTCCSTAGISLVNAHRAINDTRANKELIKYFIKNMRSESTGTVQKDRFRAGFEF